MKEGQMGVLGSKVGEGMGGRRRVGDVQVV